MTEIRIAAAREADAEIVLHMIKALAKYERLSHRVLATADDLRRHLFGKRPIADVVIAYADSKPIGFAVFFPTFSTFAGKPGLYLEDLFVEPQWRRHGVGRKLLARVAAVAVERGCHGLSWQVLTWNEPALEFYRRLGAATNDQWATYALSGQSLTKLAKAAG